MQDCSNSILKIWDKITYSFPNFNGVEVWELLGNFIPHFILECGYWFKLESKSNRISKRGPTGYRLRRLTVTPAVVIKLGCDWDDRIKGSKYITIQGIKQHDLLISSFMQHTGNNDHTKKYNIYDLRNTVWHFVVTETFQIYLLIGLTETCAPFYYHGLTLIPTWISNCSHYKVWGEITHPSLNFNGTAVEV